MAASAGRAGGKTDENDEGRRNKEMKISDLLDAVTQSGMTRSSSDRMKNSMGGGGAAGGLGGLLGNILGEAGQAVGGKRYLDQLAAGLKLRPEVTQRIKEIVGLPSA
jgi:hypothetical protein